MSAYLTLSQMQTALASRQYSAQELVEQHIQRIAQYDGPLNAVVVRQFDRSREQAAEADHRISSGSARPLEGIPVVIKEAINCTGWVTSVGNAEYAGFVSQHDAPSVRRLKAAGAIIIGKSNVPPEMADWQASNPVYGRTNNPWDLQRTCGGSSGGGAVVAAGFAPLDLGSDIGGSVRVPAAFCGVYGLRPSETLIPRSGQYPIEPTPNWGAVLGVQGPLARSAEDIATAVRIMMGPEAGEDVAWRVQLPPPRRTTLRGARVAVLPVPRWIPVDAAVQAGMEKTIVALRKAGAVVATAQPEGMGDWKEHYRLYLRFLHYMMSPRWDGEKRQRSIDTLRTLDDEFAQAQIEGLSSTGAQLFHWHLAREKVRTSWRRFFQDWDAVLTPAFHTQAFAHVALDGPALGGWANTVSASVGDTQVPYSRGLFFPHVSTLAGQPALACPVGVANGLPQSVQFIGPYLEDFTLTELASLLAREIGGFTPPSGLPA